MMIVRAHGNSAPPYSFHTDCDIYSYLNVDGREISPDRTKLPIHQ